MKKLLIMIFSIMLVMLVACSGNSMQQDDPIIDDPIIDEDAVEPNPMAYCAIYQQTDFSFNNFNEMINLYEFYIKEDGYNYAYIRYERIDGRIDTLERWKISFSSIIDGKWNNVCFINHCYYYDIELGDANPINSGIGAGRPYSIIIQYVSFLYEGTISETLIFEHNKIKVNDYYKYEINVYSDERLIITVWYDTKLDIESEVVENIIINGMKEL